MGKYRIVKIKLDEITNYAVEWRLLWLKSYRSLYTPNWWGSVMGMHQVIKYCCTPDLQRAKFLLDEVICPPQASQFQPLYETKLEETLNVD